MEYSMDENNLHVECYCLFWLDRGSEQPFKKSYRTMAYGLPHGHDVIQMVSRWETHPWTILHLNINWSGNYNLKSLYSCFISSAFGIQLDKHGVFLLGRWSETNHNGIRITAIRPHDQHLAIVGAEKSVLWSLWAMCNQSAFFSLEFVRARKSSWCELRGDRELV